MSLATPAPSQHSPHLLGLPLEAVADILNHVLFESHHLTFNDGRCIVDRNEWPIDFLYTCRFLYGAGVDAIRRAFAEHTTLVFVNCVPPASKFRFSDKLLRHLNKQERMLHLFTHSYMPFFTKVEIVDGSGQEQRPDIAMKNLRLLTVGPIRLQTPVYYPYGPIGLANMNDSDLSAWVNKKWEEEGGLRARFWSMCSMFCKPTFAAKKTQRRFAVVAKLTFYDVRDRVEWVCDKAPSDATLRLTLSQDFTWDPDTERVLNKECRKIPIAS